MDCTYCYECNKMVRSTSYDVLDGIVNFIVEKQRSCSDKTVSIVTHGGEPLIEFDKIQYFIKIKCTLCQGHYDFSFSDFYFIFVCCVEASK